MTYKFISLPEFAMKFLVKRKPLVTINNKTAVMTSIDHFPSTKIL